MREFTQAVAAKVRLEEGERAVEQTMVECYLKPGISTKELARKTVLPVPVAAAIKKELIRAGALVQKDGVHCSPEGKAYVEDELGYGGFDQDLYRKLMTDPLGWRSELADGLPVLRELFRERPQGDVRIDQSKCTMESSLKRAILGLREQSLIGKRILCVGDDDLVSISIGFLLTRLFPGNAGKHRTRIEVADIDLRFLDYIRSASEQVGAVAECHQADLRQSLPPALRGRFDCFFTDPPYTLQGMTLFLSRGIEALRRKKGLSIFLSFAHKSPDASLEMQRELVRMGLTVKEMIPFFNEYEGAEIIGNRSQMIVLQTTDSTAPPITLPFEDAIYTGDVKRTRRTYICKRCGRAEAVGYGGAHGTIEELKRAGCPSCGHDTFDLTGRTRV
ncbi:bis-aminopropyl spermidine synthase family protein [Paenibacillus sp. GCM10012303]|uniref:bis-aminopropyl spermidine synthase family protein n=1 Tax=Paenibacillus sp. GCM10012303 TaxID=3317340 RepID=UPI0036201183